jgi:hypothetical protein
VLSEAEPLLVLVLEKASEYVILLKVGVVTLSRSTASPTPNG